MRCYPPTTQGDCEVCGVHVGYRIRRTDGPSVTLGPVTLTLTNPFGRWRHLCPQHIGEATRGRQ